jgi:DNA-binding winged helix-turn-helix (wHTH) protein
MNTCYEHFKESGTDLPYPPDHHAEDILAIKKIIAMSNSLLVLGLSGFGKSSVLRFLVSNPAVQSDDVLFTYVDCNGLDWNRGKEAVEEEICLEIINCLIRKAVSFWEIGRAKSVLKSLIEEFSRNSFVKIVIVFDRSELLLNGLDQSFFNYLRSLRDTNSRISFIFGGRHLAREPFGELVDIIWSEPYWIGALNLRDATMTINRHLIRLNMRLEPEAVEKLLRCAGYHPQLLKHTCELISAGKINLNDTDVEIMEKLGEATTIKNQCQEIWQDLDFVSQDTLRHLTRTNHWIQSPVTDWLMECGVLKCTDTGELDFTSPLFKQYVAILGPPPLSVKEEIVFKGSEALTLSKEEFGLFKILWDSQPQLVSHDQIGEVVWSFEDGVSPQMITNLVKRLRDKLGDNRYIESVHGRGYRFVQGTAPLPRNSNGHPSIPSK